MEENFAAAGLRREAMLKKIMARDFQRIPGDVQFQTQDQNFNGGEFMSVEINVPGGEGPQQQMRVVVQPRFRKQLLVPKFSNHSTHMRIGKDTVSSDIKP
jgi:hypothetical protein